MSTLTSKIRALKCPKTIWIPESPLPGNNLLKAVTDWLTTCVASWLILRSRKLLRRTSWSEELSMPMYGQVMVFLKHYLTIMRVKC